MTFAAASSICVVLLIPSIWMLIAIPPLWRDVDAYIQVTQPPGPATILHYGPLYCFVARIPLYFGYLIDCLRTGASLPTASFFVHPVLTDSGVFVLLLSQHLALCVSSLYAIAVTTRMFWVRLALAVGWAANPLFYTFAHCIGTETLSMILVLLIGAMGLKIIRHSGTFPRKEWLVLGLLVWLCILTRHINTVLAALMSAAFIALGACYFIHRAIAQSADSQRVALARAKHALQNAVIAVVVGIGCIVLANASLRVLCYAAQIPYYSDVGQTFLFRLKFLAALPSEKRNQLLDDVTKHTASAGVKEMISLIRGSLPAGTSSWDVPEFNENARTLLFTRQTDPYGEKYAALLNRTALAFFYPPEEIFFGAVVTDFKRSQQITIPDVVSFLFVTTRFYFAHSASMPQCASLVTFRDKNADQVFDIFKKHSYFRHLKAVSYRALLFFWLINFAVFIVIAKLRKQEAAGLASYAAALTVIGLFMMFANCVLTVFQPRFTLPMWELTIISLSILLAKTLEYVFAGGKRRSEVVLV